MIWTIRTKLIALGALTVVSVLVLGGIAFAMLTQIERSVAHSSSLSSAIRLQGDADMMHDALHGDVLGAMLAVMNGDKPSFEESMKSMQDHAPRFREALEKISQISLSDNTLDQLKAVKPALEGYIAAAEGFFRLKEGSIQDFDVARQKVATQFEMLEKPMEELSDSIENELERATQSLAAKERIAAMVIVVAVLISVALAGVASWRIYVSIDQPLRSAIASVHSVAEGDLTREIPIGGKDEIGALLEALSHMQESLANMFTMFQRQAGALDDASHTLVSAAASVTQGSQNQCTASESIAGSLEEMNASIESVAEGMGLARATAQRAGEASNSGSKVIETLIADMRRMQASVNHSAAAITVLGEESKNIGALVNVIKEIADQTNLLALNAAIEAARAGEQGRGFAVVADEVRKLAERTANSTQQIGAMIDRVLTQVDTAVKGVREGVLIVDEGSRSAQSASNALAEIRTGVEDVVGNVNAAADSMREQASTAQHVAANAGRITRMAEENTTSSGAAENSARRLMEISETLRVAASTFKVRT